MTLTSTVSSLVRLSVDGHFNREKFTADRLRKQLAAMVREKGDSYIGEIALPDGWWFFEVFRFSDAADGWDYYLPETREQEARLKAKLFRV